MAYNKEYLRVLFLLSLFLGLKHAIKPVRCDDGEFLFADSLAVAMADEESGGDDSDASAPAPEPESAPPAASSGSGVFDVTKYGASSNGKTDNVKAFTDTWKAACAHKGSVSFVVPEGTFLLGEITFEGPCNNEGPIKVELKGNIKAPGEMSAFQTTAWITFQNIKGIAIKGQGTIDGQGAVEAWSKTKCPKQRKCKLPPTTLKVISCSDGEISGIKLVDAKAFNMRINKCTNMKLHDLHINCPGDSPNTDGIHISDSTGVKIYHSIIGVGDDCISMGDGNTDIDIRDIQCGPGHGISLGSLGKYQGEKPVNGIYVKNCTLTGTTNGVRIKSWPGSPSSIAKNITFEDITMDKVSFPIIIDQNYCPVHHCTDKPSGVKISDVTYKNIKGTSFTKLAVNLICSSSVPCQNVELSGIRLTYQGTKGETASMCQNVNPTVNGTVIPALKGN